MSQQIILLAARANLQFSPDIEEQLARISTQLFEMGTMRFHKDGGASIRKFTERGEAVTQQIKSVLINLDVTTPPRTTGITNGSSVAVVSAVDRSADETNTVTDGAEIDTTETDE